MVEHEVQVIQPGYTNSDKHLSFPPHDNKRRFENVMDAFRKIVPYDKEIPAPWKRTFIQAEIPTLVRDLELAGSALLDDLSEYGGETPKQKLTLAKKILADETNRLSVNQNDHLNIKEAKHHALIHIVERACYGTDLGSFYRYEGRNRLSRETKDVIGNAQRFFVWETVKDASDKLSHYPNPYSDILDLHFLGANRVIATDEGIFVTFRVDTDNGIAQVPYLIEPQADEAMI